MKSFQVMILYFAAAFLCSANTIVDVTFNGANPNGYNNGVDYVGPYSLTVNGDSVFAPCISFADSVYPVKPGKQQKLLLKIQLLLLISRKPGYQNNLMVMRTKMLGLQSSKLCGILLLVDLLYHLPIQQQTLGCQKLKLNLIGIL